MTEPGMGSVIIDRDLGWIIFYRNLFTSWKKSLLLSNSFHSKQANTTYMSTFSEIHELWRLQKSTKICDICGIFQLRKKCILKRPYYYSVLSLPLTTKLTLSYNILSVWQFVILNKARGWNSLIECFKSRALTSYFFFNFKEKAFI